MGKASITIAIGALWNGSTQLDKVSSDLNTMVQKVARSNSSLTQDLALQGKSWEDLGAQVYNMGTHVASLGDNLTKFVTVPMALIGGKCVDEAVDFDTAIANLRKTSDLTEDQLEDLAQSALEMSTTQPVTADTIVNIEAMGAQLGIADENLESFSKTVSGLDIATNMDADTAATEMARFANITGMAESEFSNYGSTITAIGNNMATTESETSSLAQRFASAGAAAGMSNADILAMSGALSSLGVKAEMGGSVLSQTINQISVAVAEGGDDLDALAEKAGMSADEFASAWRDNAADAFNTLIESMGKSVASGEDVNVMLGELGITGIRQSDVMRRLVDSTEAVTGKQSVLAGALDLCRNAWSENTALQDEVDQRNESMQSRLDVLKNKVSEIAITVGRPLTEALIDALNAMDPLIQVVANAAQSFADMDEEDQKTILSLVGLVAAAGPVLSITGRITQGIGNIVSLFGKAQSATAVYGDALKTLNGANVRVYSSSKDMAANLGVVKNSAVKAAGSAEQYVSAWEGMNDSAKNVGDLTKKIDGLNSKNAELLKSGKGMSSAISEQVEALESEREAAKKAFEENGKLVSTWGKSTTEAEKAAAGISELDDSLANIKSSASNAEQVMDSSTKGMGSSIKNVAQTAKTSVGNAAKEVSSSVKTSMENVGNSVGLAASSIGSMAKSFATAALQAGAISLAIAGITVVIGSLVEAYKTSKERADNLSKATDGLTGVMSDLSMTANDTSANVDNYSLSIEEVRAHVDEAIESQAKLADSMQEIKDSASAQITQVTDAYNTIKEYANQTNLSVEQQNKLRSAVETFNSQCDAQISVIDIVNGKLADENGQITDVTSSLGEYVDAKIAQIKIDAQEEMLTDLYKQQADDLKALAEAQKAYNDEVGDREAWINSYMESAGGMIPVTREEAEAAYESAKATAAQETGLNDAKAALDSCNQSIENANSSLGSSLAVLDSTNASLQDTVKSSPAVSAAIDEWGGNIDDFANSLSDAGVTVEEFSTLNSEQINDLVYQWSQGGHDMAETVKSYNGEISAAMSDNGTNAVNALANGIASGKVSVEDASEIVKQAAAGDWSDMPALMEQSGIILPESVAAGIRDGSYQPSEETDRMLGLVALKLSGGDLEAAAELVGDDIVNGLADGIKNNTLAEDEAKYLGEDVLNVSKQQLGIASPSKKFMEIGKYIDEGLAEGISGNADKPTSVIETLGKGLLDGLGTIVKGFTDIGMSAGGGLASGMDSQRSTTISVATGLRTGAQGGVSGIDKAFSQLGFSAGSGFAGGISSNTQKAENAAKSIYNVTKSNVSNAPSLLTSYGFSAGSGYAGGLRSNIDNASKYSRNLAAVARDATKGVPSTLAGYGSSAGRSFSSGIGDQRRSVANNATMLANAARNAKNYGDARGWGRDLGWNFASGISSARGWVASAASRLAQAAASYLHFSTPESGPWSGSERGGVTSGVHLADNFAKGMMSRTSKVGAAANALASSAANGLNRQLPMASMMAANQAAALGAAPAIGTKTDVAPSVVNNYTVNINGEQLKSASPRAQELIGELMGEFGLTADMGV